MKKLKKGRKFGRVRKQRRALLKSLAVALIDREKIKTTLSKAKELRPYIERLVTYAKNHTRLDLPKNTSFKLVYKITPKYRDRNGGYTRIIKLPSRARDAAKMSIIEFV